MKVIKWIAGILILILSAVGILLFTLPSTYYLRRALVHCMPKIDQYSIFESRIVEAGRGEPWPFAHDYGNHTIGERYDSGFEKYETVAYAVIQGDSLVFEHYRDGYGPGSYSNSFSMAKSIVSLLVGIAIEEGKIGGLDTPVSDFLPGIGVFDGVTMTVEHLLTMSAGVEWDESYAGLFSLTTQAYYGKNLDGMVTGMKQIAAPGRRTVYQSGVTQMLAYILAEATGMSVSQYASEKLWKPMGAEYDALWSLDRKDGTEKAYCCFNSNARDFARFGKLMLNTGSWNGDQLVPRSYMEKALTPARWLLSEYGDEPNRTYGYQFWIIEKDGVRIPYMRGILGQYVFALPQYNAVVVRLGKQRSDTRTEQRYPDDIDLWLGAGIEILESRKLTR